MSARVPMKTVNTSLITVSRKENRYEYNRQYQYFRRNPEATVCPPKPEDGSKRGPKKGSKHKQHPWLKYITVSQCEDPKEYNRQYHYFRYHPEATVCAPRLEKGEKRKRVSSKRNTTVRNPLNINITCKAKEDHNSYRRQVKFLKKNPDADYMPQYIIDGGKKPETHYLYYN